MSWNYPGVSLKTKFELFSRQCNQIHQKREEMVERIQEISNETQQLKAKIQSLRGVCSKETERAQVRLGCPPPHWPRVFVFHTNVFCSTVCRLCMTPCQLLWPSCTGESRHTSRTWNVTSPRCLQTFKWIILHVHQYISVWYYSSGFTVLTFCCLFFLTFYLKFKKKLHCVLMTLNFVIS